MEIAFGKKGEVMEPYMLAIILAIIVIVIAAFIAIKYGGGLKDAVSIFFPN